MKTLWTLRNYSPKNKTKDKNFGDRHSRYVLNYEGGFFSDTFVPLVC